MTERTQDTSGNTFAGVRAIYQLTQKEFADTFGIGIRTVQALEQGVSRPTDQLQLLYCLIRNVPDKVIGCVRELSEQRKRQEGN